MPIRYVDRRAYLGPLSSSIDGVQGLVQGTNVAPPGRLGSLATQLGGVTPNIIGGFTPGANRTGSIIATLDGASSILSGTFVASGSGFEPTIPGNAIWVDGNAANDSGSGTQASPKKLIASGVALLPAGGGGTVIIRNGTYAAAFSNSSLKAAPSWAQQNFIRAENYGGVTITGGFDITGNTNWFCSIAGLKFDDANEKDLQGGNVKVFHTGFARGATTANSSSLTIGSNNAGTSTHDILLEDCWVYGPGGRYCILIFNTNGAILRRVVTRFDGGYNNTDGAPEANITQYDSQRVECQDCIAIDALGPRPDYVATFYNAANGTAGSFPNDQKAWRGCIAINHIGYLMGSEGQANITNMVAQDCAAYGGGTGVFGVSQLKGTNTLYERITVMNQRRAGGNPAHGFGVFGGSAIVRDCIAYDCQDSAFTGVTPTTSVSFANGSNGGTVLNPLTNGMLYVPRIEAGSVLASGGTGGQRGAGITKQIGVSGTLYGEAGYNTVTSAELWPWRNEARIKIDMSSVAGLSAAQATRGFCASGESLTHYIFNRLGNGSPY